MSYVNNVAVRIPAIWLFRQVIIFLLKGVLVDVASCSYRQNRKCFDLKEILGRLNIKTPS